MGEGNLVELCKRGRGEGVMDIGEGGLLIKKGKGDVCFLVEVNFI